MPTPTKDELERAMKIPDVLAKRFEELSGSELVRRVYNAAIDDAANFVQDLAPHNSASRLTLEATAREIRVLTIPAD